MEGDDYGDLTNPVHRRNHANRRIERILSSLSYRLGNLIVESMRKPWKLVLLPTNLLMLGYTYYLERTGRKKTPHEDSAIDYTRTRECAIFFPTNGVGMGHMSRMVSLAKAIKRKNPSMEIVFFTTNYIIHHLYKNGFTCYHLPGRRKFNNMTASEWNSICEDKLSDVFALHKPSHFIFDGTYPYRGMLNAIKGRQEIHKVWVRRPGNKSKVNPPVDSYSHFDRLIFPDDYIDMDSKTEMGIDVEEINTSPPMISVSRNDLLPPGTLRRRLGIPKDALVALVVLGAGVVNEINELRSYVSSKLIEKDVYVVIADSLLNPTNDFIDDLNVRFVREYPIMQYRNCFDFAIISGGYNSIHEAVYFRLPSIIIPNENTSSDDQLSRSINAAIGGGFIVIEEQDKDFLGLGIERICDEDARLEMVNSLIENNLVTDGAPYVAEALLSIGD